MKIIVVGGGASGIMAAISAARMGASVTLIEQKDQIGKKILATGNGRCNLTNTASLSTSYYSDHMECVNTALSIFDEQDTIQFFQNIGLLLKYRDTYVYPRTDQASSVLAVLEQELKKQHIQVVTGCVVQKITVSKNGFSVLGENKEKQNMKFTCKRLILSTGGRAYKSLGSDGSGYTLAKSMGHSLSPVVPALVALKSPEKYFQKLAGIRTDVKITLFVDKKETAVERGELQLTNYGISGIPVFQISRHASKAFYHKKEVSVSIDFIPNLKEDSFFEILKRIISEKNMVSIQEALQGVFPKKLIPVLLKRAKIDPNMFCDKLTEIMIKKLAHVSKHFEVQIHDTNSFEQAQVCAGGVRTTEINNNTFESRIIPGLYLTGELLDVDGICGGYNLQWAWTSGFIAGRCAASL